MLPERPKDKQDSLPSVRAVPISRPFESRYVVLPRLSVLAVPCNCPFESRNVVLPLLSVLAVPISMPFESRYVVRPMLSVLTVPRIRPFESRHVFVSAQQTATPRTTTDMMIFFISFPPSLKIIRRQEANHYEADMIYAFRLP